MVNDGRDERDEGAAPEAASNTGSAAPRRTRSGDIPLSVAEARARVEAARGLPELEGQRARLMEIALGNVAFDGWRRAALIEAAEQEGLPPEAVDRAFPRGLRDLADRFADRADREMLARLAEEDLTGLGVRETIERAVWLRLQALEPHREAVAASARWLAHPGRGGQGPRLVWRTADRIWEAVGDRSDDYNRYTKRLLLSGVISSVMLFWLRDDSPERDRTRRFLTHRLDDVMRLGRGIGLARRGVRGVRRLLPGGARPESGR